MCEWREARLRLAAIFIHIFALVHNCAFLAEWSKALRSGRSFFGSVGSNPTGCIHIYFCIIYTYIFTFKKDLFIQQVILSQLDYLYTCCIDISFYILLYSCIKIYTDPCGNWTHINAYYVLQQLPLAVQCNIHIQII